MDLEHRYMTLCADRQYVHALTRPMTLTTVKVVIYLGDRERGVKYSFSIIK